jgi:hypothetical protein
MFIHERENWTDFRWDANQLIDVLSQVNRETGFLAGRLSAIGFDAQLSTTAQTIANDIVASSAIEGVILDSSEVRSSVARKLGIKVNDEKASTHYVDGIVEMMLDATANYLDPLSEKGFSPGMGHYSPQDEVDFRKFMLEPIAQSPCKSFLACLAVRKCIIVPLKLRKCLQR